MGPEKRAAKEKAAVTAKTLQKVKGDTTLHSVPQRTSVTASRTLHLKVGDAPFMCHIIRKQHQWVDNVRRGPRAVLSKVVGYFSFTVLCIFIAFLYLFDSCRYYTKLGLQQNNIIVEGENQHQACLCCPLMVRIEEHHVYLNHNIYVTATWWQHRVCLFCSIKTLHTVCTVAAFHIFQHKEKLKNILKSISNYFQANIFLIKWLFILQFPRLAAWKTQSSHAV